MVDLDMLTFILRHRQQYHEPEYFGFSALKCFHFAMRPVSSASVSPPISYI